jgi:hypothetical protein
MPRWPVGGGIRAARTGAVIAGGARRARSASTLARWQSSGLYVLELTPGLDSVGRSCVIEIASEPFLHAYSHPRSKSGCRSSKRRSSNPNREAQFPRVARLGRPTFPHGRRVVRDMHTSAGAQARAALTQSIHAWSLEDLVGRGAEMTVMSSRQLFMTPDMTQRRGQGPLHTPTAQRSLLRLLERD